MISAAGRLTNTAGVGRRRSVGPSWLPTVLWLGVLAAISTAWWRSYGAFQLGTYQDDAKYLLLARALAAGQRYGIDIGPAPPMLTDYPFVFPLVLAPFVTWWPDAYARMTVVSLIATLVNVTIVYRGWSLLTGNDSRWWAIAVSALYGLAPLTLGHTGMVMCEPIFSTFAWTALLLAERIAGRGKKSARSEIARHQRNSYPEVARPLRGRALDGEGTGGTVLLYVALGLACALALFTRVVGVTLVVAACGRAYAATGLAWRRVAAFCAGALLLVLPVLWTDSVSLDDLVPDRYVRTVGKPSSRTYRTIEDDLATRFVRGVQIYGGAELREALVPIGGGARESEMWNRLGLIDLAPFTSAACTVLVLVGMLAPPNDRVRPAVLWFELLTFAVLLLWPYRTARFLYPLLPFLFFQLLQGLRLVVRGMLALIDRARAPRVANATVVVTVLFLATVLPYRFVIPGAMPSTHFAPDYRAATVWLRERAPADAVVLAEEWAQIAVHAERAVVSAIGIDSPDGLMRTVQKYGVTHVLVAAAAVWRSDGQRQYSRYTQTTLLPFVHGLQQRGALEPVYEAEVPDRVRVYRLDATRLGRSEDHENTTLR